MVGTTIYTVLFYSVTGAKKPRDSASPGWAGSLSFLEGIRVYLRHRQLWKRHTFPRFSERRLTISRDNYTDLLYSHIKGLRSQDAVRYHCERLADGEAQTKTFPRS